MSCLEKLKKDYEKLEQKYGLPGFKEMNEDFDIDKLQEKETDALIREVRRAMLEKNLSYIRFMEMFLNPGNAPMFFYTLIKNMDEQERKNLNNLYLELGRHEIEAVVFDNEYNEEKEAEFIRKFFKIWQDVKIKFKAIMKSVTDSLEKKSERKEKGYLG